MHPGQLGPGFQVGIVPRGAGWDMQFWLVSYLSSWAGAGCVLPDFCRR